MTVVLARVLADGEQPFTAGLLFVVDNGKAAVAMAAPILMYMIGWTGNQVKEYVEKRGWKVERVDHKYTVVEDETG